MTIHNWEEAVRIYRKTTSPKNILDNYYDLPGLNAARRFLGSEEFSAIIELIGVGKGKTVLDLGAGSGMVSFALAESGWNVIAVEPDPSDEVGAAAIEELAKHSKGNITVIRTFGELLPLNNSSVDIVYARQALHHSNNLPVLVSEAYRVLRAKGLFLACREHVTDNKMQLDEFLNNHPLQALYGGEWAYPLNEYLNAAKKTGFKIVKYWGPEESIINYFPNGQAALTQRWREISERTWGPFGKYLAWSRTFQRYAVKRSQKIHRPAGRLYSFLWEKRA